MYYSQNNETYKISRNKFTKNYETSWACIKEELNKWRGIL